METAKFGQPEVTSASSRATAERNACPGSSARGARLQLILSGEMISAQEAYRIGLVNEIVPTAGLIARAEAILRDHANAPIAVKFALEAANKGMDTSQAEGLRSRRRFLAFAPPPKTRRKAPPPSSKSAHRSSAGDESSRHTIWQRRRWP